MEEVFETLETLDINTTKTHSSKIIETIVNRNFGNTSHYRIQPNQRQL